MRMLTTKQHSKQHQSGVPLLMNSGPSYTAAFAVAHDEMMSVQEWA
jgi:hypothetical protein